MAVYVVEVALSDHDALKTGIVELERRKYALTADSDVEAVLTATQWAHTTSGRIPMGVLLVDFPTELPSRP